MKKIIIFLFALLFFISGYSMSEETLTKTTTDTTTTTETQTETKLLKASIKFGTEIQDKEISGEAEKFPSSVGKIYCWSLIEGAEEETYITHEWYHGENKVAEVKLDIKSPRTRTWSSKTISSDLTGTWTVKVLDAKGNVIVSANFTIE